MYDGTPNISPNIAEDWMFLIFVLVLAGIAWLRYNDPRRTQHLLQSAFNIRMLRQTLREEMSFSNATSLTLSTLALMGMSLFLYVGKKMIGIETISGNGLLLFGKIVLLVFVIYTIKLLGIRVIQIMADGDFGLDEYIFNIYLFNQIAGIAVLPLMALAVYGGLKTALIITAIGALVISSLLLVRLGRGIINALRLHVRPFYIVLYLCALEILPFALLIKVIMPQSALPDATGI